MSLDLQPINFDEACEFIRLNHRHHLPPVGWKFGIAVKVWRYPDNGILLESMLMRPEAGSKIERRLKPRSV